ncbi:D-alanyl-D-alanine carboxypeptidase [bacterium]|jgi:D-alanyl-D-alanine carboxypeptidase|nr:D-alanyl-D-alanine carboxypeptidase [bacterium]MBT6831730.1 D-alanyl-D-alanine carboxypeptidase [bacterium]MBT6996553.1 D-alanyl-D-alanine carboxypeptidase [bacterium]MBT7772879.1 D-alanyl-D-alanine carboxypeptidase [bacterium]
MLEFLIFALLHGGSSDFLTKSAPGPTPKIEILNPIELPRRQAEKIAPVLFEDERTAIFAIDLQSGKTLLSQNENRPQPIASLSKIMTALILLENHDLNDVVTVDLAATEVVGARIDLYEYEKLTVRTLLEAALIPSANDAAVALAIFHAGSEKNFVEEMNAKAKELHLNSAKFVNATGLDLFDENGQPFGNKMSARDILQLVRIAMQDDFFRETVAKRHFDGTSIDEQFYHEKDSTNELFDTFLNLKGVKTGFTFLAGQCFVALGETPDGHDVLTVILGSSDRFGETKTLLSWIYDSFEWR